MNNSPALRGARALAVFLLAACSSTSGPMLPTVAGRHISVPMTAKSSALLYVSDPVANDVVVYPAAGHNQSPIATITQGIAGPAGMTTDNAGNVYVANTAGNSVTEYRRNGIVPVATYSQGLLGPVDVAVDDAGEVYVANFYSFVRSVAEFAPGSKNPDVTITDPCGCYPIGLALDAKDDLYVAYDYFTQTQVYEYAKGSTNGVLVNLQFGQTEWEAAGLLFDKAGNLLVADATLPGVQIFPAGKNDPSKAFGTRGSPRFVQFDPTEKSVFVTDTARGAVEQYDYPSGRMIDLITNGLKSVYGAAVSPRAPL